MSYGMQQREQRFAFKPGEQSNALRAIKDMDNAPAGEAATLEDALLAWGWSLIDPGDGGCQLEADGHGLKDDLLMFQALGPCVEARSYIEMSGEDGTLWRWFFNGLTCEEQLGSVIFGGRPRVLVTVRGGVVSYASDEAVDVEVVDYDQDPDATVPEAFRDLSRSGG